MLLTPRQIEKKYGISHKQLLEWRAQKKLSVHLTPRGKERYWQKDIERILAENKVAEEEEEEIPVAIYARIAKKRYLDYLEKQIRNLRAYCQEKGYKVILEVTEIASGLNENRKGIWRLINAAKQGMIKKIVVEDKERLARFGLTYLLRLFEIYGVEVEVAGGVKDDLKQEIADDLVAVVTAFSQKIYK